jgi:thiosulfate reductase cytochrome b subunit
VRRHRLSTRIWHWINAATLLVMLMSGLMIFNAHPRLYWGQYGANPDPAWLQIGAEGSEGYLRIGDLRVETTGVLGRWNDAGGFARSRAFPSWSTIPSSYNLALARRWHLTFAWVLAPGILGYVLWSLVNGHFRRELLPERNELAPGHVWQEIKHHATLNFPKPELPRRHHPPVAWDDAVLAVDQHRVGEPKLADRAGNHRHLRLGMGAGVAGVGDERIDRPVFDGKA